MAILVPHRPRYRNRTQPIYYLLGERACLRSRPKQVHDPKTPAQLMQRLRMRGASHFLTQFRGIVELGYAPERQENYRQVGAYQLALGQLMRTALVPHADGVAIDTARVQLSEGRGNPMQSATGTVAGGVLRIRWIGQLPKRCELLLVGLWNRQKGEARSLRLEGQDYGGGLGIPIPADWAGDTLDVWLAPWHAGQRGRFDSLHLAVSAPTAPGAEGQYLPRGRVADLAHPLYQRQLPSYEKIRNRIKVVDFYSGVLRRRE